MKWRLVKLKWRLVKMKQNNPQVNVWNIKSKPKSIIVIYYAGFFLL
jgi:hypothetical protein